MKNVISVSNKEGGSKNGPSEGPKMDPQTRAQKFSGRHKVESLFGKGYLLEIVDVDGLSDAAFRVLQLLKVRSAIDTEVSVSQLDIAEAMQCSRTKAKRVMRELEKIGKVRVSRRHNCNNVYVLTDTIQPTVSVLKPKRNISMGPCTNPKCRRMCRSTITKAGYCPKCFQKTEIRQAIHEVLCERNA